MYGAVVKMKKAILIILLVMMVGLASAIEVTLNQDIETKEVLSRVGKGIGSIQKERMLFDENGTNYANETYIDELKRIEQGCDGSYCYFKLFEEGGINKEFKVKLKKICSKEGMCEEFGEEYECCLSWRVETEQEILSKANIKSDSILNHIASVTLKREGKVQIVQEIQYYSCESKSISSRECPGGISGGLHTRCYLETKGKSPWDYCQSSWVEV